VSGTFVPMRYARRVIYNEERAGVVRMVITYWCDSRPSHPDVALKIGERPVPWFPPWVSKEGQIFGDGCIQQTPLNRKKPPVITVNKDLAVTPVKVLGLLLHLARSHSTILAVHPCPRSTAASL
jgi:hypothetical protein